MSASPTAIYHFRAVTSEDLPMLLEWLRQPYLAEWWGDPDHGLAEIAEAMDSVSTDPFIIELNDRPIGYIQTYDPHREAGHPYQDQPPGTLGIDISIGLPDLVGIGHGSVALRQFADALFATGRATRVIIDPHPENARALRAYRKAGFSALGLRDSQYGPALLMALDAPQQDIST